MEYYINAEGKVGILVSHGYGAGWSTWNQKELAYDKRVVEFWFAHKDDRAWLKAIDEYHENETQRQAHKFFDSIGYGHPYLGGFAQCKLEFVPRGVPFRIDEYDGFESLVVGTSEFTVL